MLKLKSKKFEGRAWDGDKSSFPNHDSNIPNYLINVY